MFASLHDEHQCRNSGPEGDAALRVVKRARGKDAYPADEQVQAEKAGVEREKPADIELAGDAEGGACDFEHNDKKYGGLGV
jgi:hypothetical protein